MVTVASSDPKQLVFPGGQVTSSRSGSGATVTVMTGQRGLDGVDVVDVAAGQRRGRDDGERRPHDPIMHRGRCTAGPLAAAACDAARTPAGGQTAAVVSCCDSDVERAVQRLGQAVAEAVEEGADLRHLGRPLVAVHAQQLVDLRAGRATRPVEVQRVRRRAPGPTAVSVARPRPFTRSIIHSSTRRFSPKPGHRKRPSWPVRNQLTWKIAGGLRQPLRPPSASGRSSRPCCSRRRAASPSGRGAPRRPGRWRRRWSPSPWSRPRTRRAPSRGSGRPAARRARGVRRR